MPTVATSLKLPGDLKARVEAASEAAGKTSHAFMVEAIEHETERAERYDAFVDEALRADREMKRTGLHYASDDVFRYMTARAEGQSPRRPKPRHWRK
jgi:predicted DNA-binding protein